MVLEGKNIMCFSSIDWDFNWQGHQEIMSALVKQGNRVLFIENTGVRSPKTKDIFRLKKRFLSWWKSFKGFRKEKEKLYIFSPLALPFPYSKLITKINTWMISKSLINWQQAMNFYNPIIWIFLPTPLTSNLIKMLEPELTIYYCIADFEPLSGHPKEILISEKKIAKNSDVIFAQGEVLKQKFLPHPNLHVFEFGVDLNNFNTNVNIAPELELLKKPIIGFVGCISDYFDQNLVIKISEEINCTVVLIGPIQTNVEQLRKKENILLLGSQPYVRVPEFMKCFDVGIIPQRITDYTKTMYPNKMYEYLAMGLPIVSTPLPEVVEFNKKNKILTIAEGSDSFVTAVKEAINSNSKELIKKRIDISKQNDWVPRIEKMSKIITNTLSNKTKDKEHWKKLVQLYKQASKKMFIPVCTMVFIYLLLFHTQFIWWVASPLKIEHSLDQANAIVVFAGGVGESGKAGGGYQERVKHAVDLYNKHKANKLIFSSGYSFSFKEAELMKQLAVNLGIPESAILLEEKAGSTYQNVLFTYELLRENNWKKIILVSSPYHMRRALLTWEKNAPDIKVIASPVKKSQYYDYELGPNTDQIRGILHEYASMLVYWWRDWI